MLENRESGNTKRTKLNSYSSGGIIDDVSALDSVSVTVRLGLNARNVFLALEGLDPKVRLILCFLGVVVCKADFKQLLLLHLEGDKDEIVDDVNLERFRFES